MDSLDDDEGRGASDGSGRAIERMVATTERTEGTIAIGAMAVCIGLPLLSGIVRRHPVLGAANALLLGLVGWGLLLLVQALLLQPISIIRYGRAADRLARALRSASGTGALQRSWADDAPGAITVAADGHVWLADRSTGFRSVTLAPADIIHAEAVTIVAAAPRARRSWPSVGVGVPLGGGLVAAIVPGRSKPAETRVRHAVAITYRDGDTGAACSTAIPFGADGEAARTMAAVVGSTTV